MTPDDPAGDDASVRPICIFAAAPLLTVTLEHEVDERPQMHLHVGGQGAWIARMVRTLGGDVHYCGAFGGETGDVVRRLCEDEAFEVHAIPTSGWNGAYVHDRRTGERVELAYAPPVPLTRHELDDLYSMTLSVALESGACVISGTHSPGVVPDEIFRRLATDLGAGGVPVVCDVSGTALVAALEGQPSIVKLSDDELEEGGWTESRSVEHVVDAIRTLHDRGAAEVVVSRGADPTIALMDGHLYQVSAPEVGAVDTHGGGDAMTGALAVAKAGGLGPEDALCLASAAAVATVTRHGLGTGRADLITAAVARVELEPLD